MQTLEDFELPDWRKELIDIRLAEYKNAPSQVIDWKTISEQLEEEDEEI